KQRLGVAHVFEGRARRRLLEEAAGGHTETREEAGGDRRVALVGSAEGAVAAGDDNSGLRVAFGQPQRLDEAVTGLVHLDFAARGDHLRLEAAAENDDASGT